MSTRNSVLAFMSGAAIGAVVALLFAPEKGEVTRRRIRRAVEDGRDKLIDGLEHGREAIVEGLEHGRDILRRDSERVRDMYEDGRERLADAVHEGRERLADAIAGGRELAHEEVKSICDTVEKKTRPRPAAARKR